MMFFFQMEKQQLAQEAERFLGRSDGGSFSPERSEDELMGMLSDLKHLSNARPAVLPLLTEELVQLIGHSSRQIRGLSYELVLRLLRHSPTAR